MNDIVVCRRGGGDRVLALASENGIEWIDAVTGAPVSGTGTDDVVRARGLALHPFRL